MTYKMLRRDITMLPLRLRAEMLRARVDDDEAGVRMKSASEARE